MVRVESHPGLTSTSSTSKKWSKVKISQVEIQRKSTIEMMQMIEGRLHFSWLNYADSSPRNS